MCSPPDSKSRGHGFEPRWVVELSPVLISAILGHGRAIVMAVKFFSDIK